MRNRPVLLHLAAFGFYLLVAALVTYPLIVNLPSVLVGFVHGDGYEMAHHIWWFKYALQTGQPLFYQTMLGYPNGMEGVTLWSNPLQFFPAWLLAFILPLPAAANLTLLLTLALNGWAMFALTHSTEFRVMSDELPSTEYRVLSTEKGKKAIVTGDDRYQASEAVPRQEHRTSHEIDAETLSHHSSLITHHPLFPPLLAGLVFMLYPTMQGHLGAGHAGLMVQWGVPIYVYALLRLRRSGASWRSIALAALGIVLSAAGHTLQVIYVVMPVTALYGLLLIARREWTALRRTVIAVLIGALALAVFLIPVAAATFGTSAYADEGGMVRYSADLLAVVTPSFFHPLFDQFEYTHRVLGVNLDEGAAYIGIVAAILSLIAVIRVKAARWWLALALAAWVLSLGPLLKVFDQPVTLTVDDNRSLVTLPFALLAELPLFSLARTPGRFNFTLALAVAAMAGYGALVVWRWIRLKPLRPIVFTGLMALIAFEYQTFFPLPTIPAAVPEAVRALSEREDVRAVFGVPWDNLIAAKYDLYLQTAHQRPLIAGHVTRRTPVSSARLSLLERLDPRLLNTAGVDVVIVHREQDDGTLETLARDQLGEPFYEDSRIVLFETPNSAEMPPFIALPTALERVETRADSYVYAPESGWVTLTATLDGDGRDVTLLLDDMPVHAWTVEGDTPIRVPLPISARHYRAITLTLDPPCPLTTDPSLECRAVEIADLTLEFTPIPEERAVFAFEHGVRLDRWHVPQSARAGETLSVWLSWSFQEARVEHDIRFVHLIDESGELVGQQDNTLGVRQAGTGWAEQIDLALPADLPPGEYQVYAGWYLYPDITNFCVLANESGECAAREALIGTVSVRDE